MVKIQNFHNVIGCDNVQTPSIPASPPTDPLDPAYVDPLDPSYVFVPQQDFPPPTYLDWVEQGGTAISAHGTTYGPRTKGYDCPCHSWSACNNTYDWTTCGCDEGSW
jgi:hypothetical protein